MASVPYHVATSFLNGKKDRAGNFYTDGQTLYTYAVPLAKRLPSGEIVYTSNFDWAGPVGSRGYGRRVVPCPILDTFSPTSSRHQRATRSILGCRRVDGKETYVIAHEPHRPYEMAANFLTPAERAQAASGPGGW